MEYNGRSWQRWSLLSAVLIAAGCSSGNSGTLGAKMEPFSVESSIGASIDATPLVALDQPWAMTFLPDGRLLITEKPGRLLLVSANGTAMETVEGLPSISASGQGGLGDVIIHPEFADNQRIYLSYVEREQGSSGAVVAMARLVVLSPTIDNDGIDGEVSTAGSDANAASEVDASQATGTVRLEDFEVIWRQDPKTTGSGHYGHRLAFSPAGELFITSGERQKFTPAQDLDQNLGKIIRLQADGGVPGDNPFQGQGNLGDQVWSIGHRNPLGIAFDGDGQLWVHEMGPRGGDELNLIRRGGNYGYPEVSNGDHYDGEPIPDHDTAPQFDAPATSWNPVISPAGMVIYPDAVTTEDGSTLPAPFGDWAGNALIGGLSSEALVRVSLEAGNVREEERFEMPARIREVELDAAGKVYLLEDGAGGRLLVLDPPAGEP